MVFEDSWLNHTLKEISLNWLLSGLKEWEEEHSFDENYTFTQLKKDVTKEIESEKQKCPQCVKNKLKECVNKE